MAGHSHWANIKHKKAVNDRAKAKVLARMGKLIAIACQFGPPKLEDNPRLRLAVQKARASNMNNEAIDRAIKKAAGIGAEGRQMQDVVYEGYAPGGVAVVVVAATDNRNRTAPEVKKLFEYAGGAIGAPGCVAWQFKDKSVFLAGPASEEQVMEALLAADADAEDIVAGAQGQVEITAAPNQYDAILQALAKAKIAVIESDLTKIPDNTVPVADPAVAKAIQDLVAGLEEHPDVQEVFTNAAFAEVASG
jgi:YebC/PmpR family DNA-binding regulatory protein